MKYCFRWMVLVAAGITLCVGSGLRADIINDDFPGTSLGSRWQWVNEDSCSGRVENSLFLYPITQWRQAAIGSSSSNYSWAANGGEWRYQFTVGDWNVNSDSNVQARLFLTGNGSGSQPDSFSDYNKPNVILGKLEQFDTGFGWELWVKTNAPNQSADEWGGQGVRRYAGLWSIPYATNTVFGYTLNGTNVTLWYTQDGSTVSLDTNLASGVVDAFSDGATVYVAAKNNTDGNMTADEYVRISNVTVIPEPGVATLVTVGLLFCAGVIRRRRH